jgi:hypothetical protein
MHRNHQQQERSAVFSTEIWMKFPVTYLQCPVLGLNGNNLVPDELQNAVDNRLEAL